MRWWERPARAGRPIPAVTGVGGWDDFGRKRPGHVTTA
jgi:hypothetical protein